MMKMINSKIHGFLDYGLAAVFLIGPSILNFSAPMAQISYSFGIVALAVGILTDFPLGLVKVIPFRVHGKIDLVLSVMAVLIPWLMNFAHIVEARNFFVVLGLCWLIVWALTDYRILGEFTPRLTPKT